MCLQIAIYKHLTDDGRGTNIVSSDTVVTLVLTKVTTICCSAKSKDILLFFVRIKIRCCLPIWIFFCVCDVCLFSRIVLFLPFRRSAMLIQDTAVTWHVWISFLTITLWSPPGAGTCPSCSGRWSNHHCHSLLLFVQCYSHVSMQLILCLTSSDITDEDIKQKPGCAIKMQWPNKNIRI